jgi:transmembrane sensor
MSHHGAHEEASVWLAKLTRGLRDGEGAELHEWLRSRKNRSILIEAASLYHGLDVLLVLRQLFPDSPELLNHRSEPRRDLVATALKAVAAVCIVAIGTLMLMGQPPSFLLGNAPYPQTGSITRTYATAIGERRQVKLPDGSTVTLNTRTRMTVNYSLRLRDVHLEYGEASFDVTPNPERPFNVRAGRRELQALGTRFIVRVLDEENVQVTVTQGAVKVVYAPPRWPETPAKRRENLSFGETLVGAQETALVEPGYQSVRELVPGEAEARLAWQKGMIIFDGTPLEAALAEVDRYTTAQFVVADDRIRNVLVGGDFRAGDVDGLLTALRRNFRIDSRRDAQGRIVLTALATH